MSAPYTHLIGRLVRDPELGETTNGTPVCKIRVACDGGGRDMEAGYYDVVQYGNGGKAAAKTLTKGWLISATGRLEYREWPDNDTGKQRHDYTLIGQIEFLSAPLTDEEKAARAAHASYEPSDLPALDDCAPVGVGAASDDDIPF
jgi:single-strand DNA-binding protein